jgi:hypothetical protein
MATVVRDARAEVGRALSVPWQCVKFVNKANEILGDRDAIGGLSVGATTVVIDDEELAKQKFASACGYADYNHLLFKAGGTARLEQAGRYCAYEVKAGGTGLLRLPESIGKLRALQHLRVDSNQLTALPESIGQLAALQELYASKNQLTALPESIGQLAALQHLHVDSNQLTALPESIGQLAALKQLHVDSNQLTALPESIGHLAALEQLNVNCNLLTAVPESIGQLTARGTHVGLINQRSARS